MRSNYQSFLKYAGDLPDAFGHAAHARQNSGQAGISQFSPLR